MSKQQHWAFFLYDSKSRTMEVERNRLLSLHQKAQQLQHELFLMEMKIEREEREFEQWCSSDWSIEEIQLAKAEANANNGIEFFDVDPNVNGQYEGGLKIRLRTDTNAPLLFLEWLAIIKAENKKSLPVRFTCNRGEDTKGNGIITVRFYSITKQWYQNCLSYIRNNL